MANDELRGVCFYQPHCWLLVVSAAVCALGIYVFIGNDSHRGYIAQICLLIISGLDAFWRMFMLTRRHSLVRTLNNVIAVSLVGDQVHHLVFEIQCCPSLMYLLLGIRCVMAIYDAINFSQGTIQQKALYKTLVVTESSSHFDKHVLSVCLVTPRIIVVIREFGDAPEYRYLEERYSGFLKCFNSPNHSNSVIALHLIADSAEECARHLGANPLNVVCVACPGGDSNGLTIVGAVLLRLRLETTIEGVIHRLKAGMYDRTIVSLKNVAIVSHTHLSQLCILRDTYVVRNMYEFSRFGPIHAAPYTFRRILISECDPGLFSDMHVTVVDVVGRRILHDNILPVLGSNSVTFLLSDFEITLPSDVWLLFSSSERKQFGVYLNCEYHLKRKVGFLNLVHHIVYGDACDHYKKAVTRSVQMKIEIIACTDPCGETSVITDLNYHECDDLRELPAL